MTKKKRDLYSIAKDYEALKEIAKANIGERVKTTLYGYGYLCGYSDDGRLVVGLPSGKGWRVLNDGPSRDNILKEYPSYTYATIPALRSLRHKGKC